MHSIIDKTFGGLTHQYYFRNFVFGLIFPIFFYLMLSMGKHPIPTTAVVTMTTMAVVSALLYPYPRFTYEGIVGFILGNNVFWVNAIFMLFVKLMTMSLCFCFAIFIAPFGLTYLYFRNSRQ